MATAVEGLAATITVDTRGFATGANAVIMHSDRMKDAIAKTQAQIASTSGSMGRLGGATSSVVFAIDDFVTGMNMATTTSQGLAMGLRGAGNNLSMLAMTLGGAKAGLAAIAAIGAGQLIANQFARAKTEVEEFNSGLEDLQETMSRMQQFQSHELGLEARRLNFEVPSSPEAIEKGIQARLKEIRLNQIEQLQVSESLKRAQEEREALNARLMEEAGQNVLAGNDPFAGLDEYTKALEGMDDIIAGLNDRWQRLAETQTQARREIEAMNNAMEGARARADVLSSPDKNIGAGGIVAGKTDVLSNRSKAVTAIGAAMLGIDNDRVKEVLNRNEDYRIGAASGVRGTAAARGQINAAIRQGMKPDEQVKSLKSIEDTNGKIAKATEKIAKNLDQGQSFVPVKIRP